MIGPHLERSCTVSDWIVYWYIALLDRPPMRRSWTGWRNAEATGRRFNWGRRRLMISAALTLRSASGLIAMNMEPLLVAPPPPVNAITFSTAGSFLITAPICRMESSIAAKDESGGPRTEPEIDPVSTVGKKPLDILWINTTLSAMVTKRTTRG